jgi:dTDP-glucose 4,6-dehydratase
LVTGAGGFIGSHLTEALVRRGAQVRSFVRYNSRGDRGLLDLLPADVMQSVDVRFGDLRDADTVRRAADGVDTIFHLGALIAIPYSYVSPRDVVDTNVLGSVNVLEAARAHGVRRMLQTSTSEVYGTAQYVPIDEKHPLQGQSPYAASKIGSDQIAESYHRSFDLPVSIVRPFNTYGPRQSARAIIPTIISQALAGSTLRLGSLSPTRDLLYVTDTAAGFCAVAETDAAIGRTLNLGTGCAVSIGDLVAAIGRILGVELDVVEDSQRVRPARSEVHRLLADATQARDVCGWEARVSLEEGLRRVIEWMRDNRVRYRPEVYAV